MCNASEEEIPPLLSLPGPAYLIALLNGTTTCKASRDRTMLKCGPSQHKPCQPGDGTAGLRTATLLSEESINYVSFEPMFSPLSASVSLSVVYLSPGVINAHKAPGAMPNE